MAEQMAHKVVLSSGKAVLIKDMKIKYNRLAIASVGNRAGENKALLGMMVQEELLKILLISIDGKTPEKAQLEDLDSLFTNKDFMELMQVIGKVAGTEQELGNLATEIVTIGQP